MRYMDFSKRYPDKRIGLDRINNRRNRAHLLSIDDSSIVALFRAHCEAGWSPRMFMAKLIGHQKAYNILLKFNEHFKEIHDQYTLKTKYIKGFLGK